MISCHANRGEREDFLNAEIAEIAGGHGSGPGIARADGLGGTGKSQAEAPSHKLVISVRLKSMPRVARQTRGPTTYPNASAIPAIPALNKKIQSRRATRDRSARRCGL